MNSEKKSLFGEHDQDLLFRAFAHLAATTTRKSINIIIGMIHICIQDVVESSKISILDARKLDEEKRRELLENGLDEFIRRAKIGAVQRRIIKNGCMSIYDKWKRIRSSIIEERDINLEELLDDPSSNLVGYEDQEVLLAAFTHYILSATGKEKNSIIKLIRICMLEVTIPKRVNFKETRFLDEETRREMVLSGIEEYIKKAHIGESQASIIKTDCMKVYERWKEIRRVNPDKDTIGLIELVNDSQNQ